MADKLLAEWFWTDRWMGSSAFLLPIDARGLYREMLTQAWRRQGILPNNHEMIQRACGVTAEEWVKCWPLVKRYWVETENGDDIYNETQQEVIAETLARREKASAKASHAAKARWGNAPKNAPSNAPSIKRAMPEQCPPSLSLSKDQPQTPEEKTPPKSPKWGTESAELLALFRQKNPEHVIRPGTEREKGVLSMMRRRLQGGRTMDECRAVIGRLVTSDFLRGKGYDGPEYGFSSDKRFQKRLGEANANGRGSRRPGDKKERTDLDSLFEEKP